MAQSSRLQNLLKTAKLLANSDDFIGAIAVYRQIQSLYPANK
jgi:hypothetical protein